MPRDAAIGHACVCEPLYRMMSNQQAVRLCMLIYDIGLFFVDIGSKFQPKMQLPVTTGGTFP